MSDFIGKIRESYNEWSKDDAPRLGAALAYYTLFSMAPLLIIVIAIGGMVFGQDAAHGYVFDQLSSSVGAEPARYIQDMLAQTAVPRKNIAATLIGIAALFIGATGLFAQLKDALNTVWEVRPSGPLGFMGAVKRYWWSFTMVLGTGFLLLVSLIMSVVLTSVGSYASEKFAFAGILSEIAHLCISTLAVTALFACIFKFVPDVEVRWRHVWSGSLLTAVMFNIGKSVLALYLSWAAVASPYGAAGVLVTILVWCYYTAQLLLFGAEYTQVIARRHGTPIVAKAGFEIVSEIERQRPVDGARQMAGNQGQGAKRVANE